MKERRTGGDGLGIGGVIRSLRSGSARRGLWGSGANRAGLCWMSGDDGLEGWTKFGCRYVECCV